MRMYQEKISIFNAFIVAVVFYLVATPVLYAARETVGIPDPCASATAMSSGCATVANIVSCYNGTSCTKKESCGTCRSGYDLTEESFLCGATNYSYNVCKGSSSGGATVFPGVVLPGTQYPVVVGPGYTVADGCGAAECDCYDPWDWKAVDKDEWVGVEFKQTYTCNKNTNCECEYTTEYRCAKGYHGTATSESNNCAECPEVNGVRGTTSGPGKTKKTDCYIPSSQSLTDDIGTYKFSTQCNAK